MISAVVTAIVSFASTNIDDIFVLMVFFSQISKQMKKRHIIIGQYFGIATLLFVSVLGSAGLNLIPQQYTGLLGIVPILLGIKEWLKYRKEKKAADNSTNESEMSPDILPDTLMGNSIIIDNSESVAVIPSDVVAPEVEKLAEERKVDIPKDKAIVDFNDANQPPSTIKDRIISTISKLIHPAVINVFLVTIANGADNIGVYIPLFMRQKTFELVVTILIFMALIALWCFIAEKLTDVPRVKHTIQKYKSIIVPIVFIMIGIYILIKSDLFALL